MNIKSVNDYFPEMDIIDSDIKDKVKNSFEEVKEIEVSRADVISSLEASDLNERDLYNLLSDTGLEYLEDMARVAKDKRIRYFGNNVCLFSPIYIANYCENSCRYCGFRAKSDIKRAKLTYDEIEEEMKALAKTGIEDVLILTGESKKFSSVEYIAEACRIAKKYFKVIGIEVYPANVSDYEILREAGADFVTVFQESYNPEVYDYYHPYGHKRSFPYRFDTQERALKAGYRGVGFGTLFGLGDPIEEAFKLAMHAKEIQKKYPQALATMIVFLYGESYYKELIWEENGDISLNKISDLNMRYEIQQLILHYCFYKNLHSTLGRKIWEIQNGFIKTINTTHKR